MSLSHLSAHRGRILGLSKNQQVKPLLTIPGRDNRIKAEEVVNKQLKKIAMSDPNDSDPPVSVSSGDESPSRADIRPTNFGPGKKAAPSSQTTTRPTRQAAQERARTTRTSSQVASSNSSQPSSSAEGNRDRLSQESVKSRKRKSPETTKPAAKSVGAGFNIFGEPLKVQPINKKKYTRRKAIEPIEDIEDDEPEGDSPKRRIYAPPKDVLATNTKSPSPRKFRPPPPKDSLPLNTSPDKKRFKSSLGREKPKVESPEAPRPKFVIPELFSTDFQMEEDEEKGLDDDFDIKITNELSFIDSAKPSKPVCPLCEEEVDEKVRARFDEKYPGKGFSLRREQRFCLYHKKDSAKKTWKTKGYPKINWTKLDKRIAKQHSFLQAILEGGHSYYGDNFNNSVKSGQNRTLLKSDQNMTPGYYGIRGLRVMTDNLTYKFSRLLRERAVQDRLISSRGYMAYLQSVLVPELAVQLIKEDMSVSEEKARSIMEESITVGELLNEEVKDVVKESGDEQDKSLSDLESF